MNPINSKYSVSLERIRAAVQFEKVDKTPVSINGPAFIANAQGVPLKEYITDFPRAVTEALQCLDSLGEVESAQSAIMSPYGLCRQWLSPVAVPGVELPDNELWQVMEAETIQEEDYDKIEEMGFYNFVDWLLKNRLNDPDSKMVTYNQYKPTAIQRFAENGYVILNHFSLVTPFEHICGGRSLCSFLADDLCEEPEKVEKVFKIIRDESIPRYEKQLKEQRPFGVWVGGWRSSPNFISPAFFDRFVWPYLYEYTMLAIRYGAVPTFHLDGNWDFAMEYFKEFPPRSCIMSLDGTTDIRHARAVLGDHMCLMGDVPASMFAFGTADEVYAYTQKLIADVGPDTGFIACSGCDIPANAKYENVKAMVQAAEDFKP